MQVVSRLEAMVGSTHVAHVEGDVDFSQQPCYCRCDREMGHNSLHSCFEGTHGAACSTGMKEGVFAYQMTKKGKTPAQIRAAIERGEWMNVDLEKAAL